MVAIILSGQHYVAMSKQGPSPMASLLALWMIVSWLLAIFLPYTHLSSHIIFAEGHPSMLETTHFTSFYKTASLKPCLQILSRLELQELKTST